MIDAGLYRDLFIAISSGVAGALLAFFGQLVVQRYRAYLDRISQLRNEVYVPLYNEIAAIKDDNFPSTPRTKWQSVSSHLKLKVDDGLKQELDNYNDKFNELIRVQNKLVASGGVFEEKLPEDLKTRSNAHLTLRAQGDFDLPNHSIQVKTFLDNFEDELFDADSPEELRKNLMVANDGNLTEKLDAANEEWTETVFDCIESEPAQRWKKIRDRIRDDAKSLEPKLQNKVTGWREKIRI